MVIPSDLPRVNPQRTESLPSLPLRPGQTLEARVVGPGQNGATQVEIRGQVVSLNLPVAVNPGQTIRLEVQGQGQQMQLAMQVAAQPAPASPAPANPAQQQPSMPLPQAPTMPVATTPQAAVQNAQQAMVQAQFANQPDATLAQPTTPAAQNAQTAPNAANVAGQGPQAGAQTPNAAAQPSATAAQPQTATPTGTPAPNAAPQTVTTQVTQVVQQAVPQMPASLYPQALPGLPNPAAVAPAAVALNQPASAANLPRGDVAPVIAAAPIGGSSSNALAGNTSGMPNPQQPATPQAALNQMMQTSMPRQAPVTDLTAALSTIAGKVVLPEPVARAAQMVMAGRVAIDGKFDGAALQQAVRGSGVFQEAALAKGQMPLPQADMKTALLALRQTLVNWLGNQAPVAAVAHVPPPLKGITPRARSGGNEAPPIDPGDPPEEIGRHLLERTESALARTRMHQHASMQDPAAKTADWSMDLPVMIGQHQTMMQLQIHRDEGGEAGSEGERGWQMRFAINLPSMGEVGAQVSLRAGTTGVMLWATEPETSAALDADVNSLRDALTGAGLKTGAVIVRHGEPHVPPVPESSGHFVDERT